MGIEPTTSGLLDQRRSRSDNQAPISLQGNLFSPITLITKVSD